MHKEYPGASVNCPMEQGVQALPVPEAVPAAHL
jgi:hypothetical protein